MRILTASDRALLVEVADVDEAIRGNLAWARIPGVVELVPAARTVLVRFDPAFVSAAHLAEMLRSWPVPDGAIASRDEVEISVRYDGEDLAEVAGLLGVSAEEVVRRHLAAEWRVAFAGFAPGFGYIAGSDPLLDVPRRATPRTRVPAGAVGLAGRFTGVYPRESPGGWQLIGRTEAVLWDVDREPPALLVPGTRVRFVRALRERGAISGAGTDQDPVTATATDPTTATSGARLEVLQTVFPVLVQDRGRPGHAAIGVSASGAADWTAMRDANVAVGNPSAAPVLEALGGLVVRFRDLRGGDVAALAGAEAELVVVGAGGSERLPAMGAPFALADGDELHLGTPTRGQRSILAVRGGFDVRATLGSAATDTLAGLGPAPLRAGDAVGLGDPRQITAAVRPFPIPRALPAPGEQIELRITLGPRDDWFTAEAIRTLTGQDWEVTPRSDRIGIRLQGAVPLRRAVTEELPSEGAVTGAIQVPPDGQPVLFLPDHPLTGGYPVIAAVVDGDLDLAGQLPPGCRVRFRVVGAPAD